jgi:mannose-1-phosphate guanylyltransferase/phosphomannomutase
MVSRGQITRVHAIVLAGGHPWDERSFDAFVPRCLVPLLDAPLLAHILPWLRRAGITSATLCANGSSAIVRQALGDGQRVGLDFDYYEDRTPRGPAGCVRDAASAHAADAFVVVDGAVLTDIDLADLVGEHLASGASLTSVLTREPGTPATAALTPAGVFVFAPAAIAQIPPTGYQDTKEVLIPRLRRAGLSVAPYITEQPCFRVAGTRNYLAVQEALLARWLAAAAPPPGYRRHGEALVHATATVAPDALMLGPALIAAGARVAGETTLVGPVVLMRDSVVERGAVVSRAAIWPGAQIAARGRVDRAIVVSGAATRPGQNLWHTLLLPGDSPAATVED